MNFEIRIDDATVEEIQGVLRTLIAQPTTLTLPGMQPVLGTTTTEDTQKTAIPAEPAVQPVQDTQPVQEAQQMSAGPTEPAAQTTSEVDLDVTGLPWDKRIHGGGTTKLNKDGSWRKKRNLPDETWNAIVAELRTMYPERKPMSTGPTEQAATTGPQEAPTNYIELIGFMNTKGIPIEDQNRACVACGIQSTLLLAGATVTDPTLVGRIYELVK